MCGGSVSFGREKIKKSRRQSRLIFLDKPFYSVKFDAFYLLVLIYLDLHLHLYFYTFVLRSYCNAQVNIYIDNCAIEINKIIIIIIIITIIIIIIIMSV